jgi:hypothetical protein
MNIGLPELAIILIGIGGGILWIWMLIDCATKEPSGTDKIVWILIILLGGCAGAAVYFFVRRMPRNSRAGG